MVYYKFIYSERARRDIKRLDHSQSEFILKKLDAIFKMENPFLLAKKLENTNEDSYRFRIGDYRTVFRIDEKTKTIVILLVLRVLHRKEAYKNL